MLRMLINATQAEELRVAVANGQKLVDLDIETPALEQKKANVYKGKITRVEPSLEACFVDFGSTRHGFLPLKEICPQFYHPSVKNRDGKVSIQEAVKEGQEILIQVEKEERGNKGAALTTYISLAGRYLVLMPTNPKAGGVSRRISNEDRQELREQLQNVISPDNVGIIIRTAGVGREAEELQWDLDYLLQLWSAIEKAASERSAPFLVYQESNLFIRALRDHMRNDIGEILVDDRKVYEDARRFIEEVMPHNVRKLKLYTDDVPLFSRYQIESQIESAFNRTVHLPSGGSLVIDHTEAMVCLDVNSARATKGSDIEETAYHTNLEAAEEIARQLRLRDLGGLVVIDFIDMMDRKHQRDVEERLKHALQIDKARVQTGRISRFGLLEMSRQRLRPSLGESSQESCPRCEGHGTIRSIESLALSILRLAEEEAMKDYTGQVLIQVPTRVANFLLNEKRKALNEIETRHEVPILVLANEHMERPRFEIERIRKSDVSDEASYTHVKEPEDEDLGVPAARPTIPKAVPAVTATSQARPALPRATRGESKQPGFFGKIFSGLFSSANKEAESPPIQKPAQSKASSQTATAGRTPAAAKREAPGKTESQGRGASGERGPEQGKKATRKRPPRKRAAKKKRAKKVQAQKPTEARSNQADTGPTPEKKENAAPAEAANTDGTPKRRGRRRRSRYKTGGEKPRESQSGSDENNHQAAESGSKAEKNPASDNLVKGDRKDTKPAHQAKAESKDSAASAPAPESANPGKAADKASTGGNGSAQPGPSEKTSGNRGAEPAASPASSKPAETGNRPSTEAAQSSSRNASPAGHEPVKSAAVERDSKGIYTLKPSAPDSAGQTSEPAAKSSAKNTGSSAGQESASAD